ncbi:hypothetical protein TWF481_003826 [Arthrobotrys musiformis]|uniref:Uncharacterized protein n=1 Tax=Arthrobotrys musiformis TaxID=47236 RepID=A0AAV9WJC0_9PEZI
MDCVKRLWNFQSRWREAIRLRCPDPPTEVKIRTDNFLSSLDDLSREASTELRDLIIKQTKKKGRAMYSAMDADVIKASMKGYYAEALEKRGQGASRSIVKIILQGLEDTNPFEKIEKKMCDLLRDLKVWIDESTKEWYVDLESELQATVKNWTKKSRYNGRLELKKREELEAIVVEFRPWSNVLLTDIRKLEAEAGGETDLEA